MMMNNQNTSGSDRMSENNNLNPQTNSGNINSSERTNINSILNGSNSLGNESSQEQNSTTISNLESIPQTGAVTSTTSVETPSTVNPINNDVVIPKIESIPQTGAVTNTTSVETPSIVSPINNDVAIPKIESIPQTETEGVEISVEPSSVVSSSNNDAVSPTVESIPQTGIEVDDTLVEKSSSVDSNLESRVVENPNVVSNNPAIAQMNGMVNAINSTVSDNQNVASSVENEFNVIPAPPVFEENIKKKEKGNFGQRFLIIFLIVILILTIGFGVYYFLTMTKTNSTSSIETKELKLELGTTLSQNVSNYADIKGFKSNNCSLDLSNVDVSRVSTYKYYVTCGDTKKEGTIIVDDTTAPQLVLNDLTVLPNAQIKPEDFVEQCMDASNCTFKFTADYQAITKEIGEYDIEIEASDDFNNKTVLNTKLIVTLNAPVKYMMCTSKETVLENNEANYVDAYKIGMDANNNFLNATRISQFSYNDETSYSQAAQNYDKNNGIHNIIGTESFSPTTKTITLKSNKALKDIENDLNGTLSKNMSLFSIYMEGYGYTCK